MQTTHSGYSNRMYVKGPGQSRTLYTVGVTGLGLTVMRKQQPADSDLWSQVQNIAFKHSVKKI